MILIIFLILTEAISLVVLRQHFFVTGRTRYHISLVAHFILSIWFWVLMIDVLGYGSFFDNPDNVWRFMAVAGMICAVILPRLLVIVVHFTGKWIKRKTGGHIRWLTNAGLAFSLFVLAVVGWGTLYGKLNFRYENVPVSIKGLNPELEGLKIVQISDLHLSGFYHHPEALQHVVEKINSLNPDLIINTGDFITIGWREFGRNDTVLASAKGRYGNFAIMGNHDAGIYHPEFTPADIENHRLIMNNLVKASGYNVLNDESTILKIGTASIGLIGVTTSGRHPNIIHGDVKKAAEGLDSLDLQILLTHDPNQWLEDVAGKYPEIKLTLSGHTHGMQLGIMTRWFKWSPSQYFYPHWNGLYRQGDQLHYVNRGLGVLAIPFRIWMPPEITIITLQSGD
ncbi:MAG TPA: metallophosphoesterase [Bacteroidales bacterium]|nr:metallophosphoesterase [Bacteroidales bacterium]